MQSRNVSDRQGSMPRQVARQQSCKTYVAAEWQQIDLLTHAGCAGGGGGAASSPAVTRSP